MRETMDALTIIKFGGSIITDKTVERTPNIPAMKMLVSELKEYLGESKERVIVVSGGGSFPHPVAKKFHLKEGIRKSREFDITFEEALWALSDCAHEASAINHILWEEFLRQGLPAVSFRPSSMMTAREGVVTGFDVKPLKNFLELGIIPLLYGDVIFDEISGNTIASSEIIIKELMKYVPTKRVIMCTNVDGLFTKDPREHDDAEMIEIYSEKLMSGRLELTGIFKSKDVTGGMKHKVETLAGLARAGISSVLCNGGVEGNLLKALRGEKVGTEFRGRKE